MIIDLAKIPGFVPVYFADWKRLRAIGRKRVKGERSGQVERNANWKAFVARQGIAR